MDGNWWMGHLRESRLGRRLETRPPIALFLTLLDPSGRNVGAYLGAYPELL